MWNPDERRIEMHLVSRIDQRVRIVGRGDRWWTSRRGERIWTESSYKYDPDGIVEMGAEAGFLPPDQWVDSAGGIRADAARRHLVKMLNRCSRLAARSNAECR